MPGRTLDELKPDEIHIMAKVLPAFSHEQKLTAYRNILEEAIATGKTKSTQFIGVLVEIRGQMEITQQDHDKILESLGVEQDTMTHDASIAISSERDICIANYIDIVGTAIANQIEAGHSLAAAVAMPEITSTVTVMRASLQISDADHAHMLDQLTCSGGMLTQRMESRLTDLLGLLGVKFRVQGLGSGNGIPPTMSDLVLQIVAGRLFATYSRLLSMLQAFGPTLEALSYAAAIYSLADGEVATALARPATNGALATWNDALDTQVLQVLCGQHHNPSPSALPLIGGRTFTRRDVIKVGMDHQQCLELLMQDNDPVTQAIALTAFSYLDPERTRDIATRMTEAEKGPAHWLLSEVIEDLLGSGMRDRSRELNAGLRLTLLLPDRPPQVLTIIHPYVTIGRAPGNDVVVADKSVSPYHIAIHHQINEIRVVRLDSAMVYVNAEPCTAQSVTIETGTSIAFAEADEPGPTICLEWTQRNDHYGVQEYDTVTKLFWLAHYEPFHARDLSVLARIAGGAEGRRCPEGAVLCDQGGVANELLFLQVGEVERVTVTADGSRAVERLQAGERTYALHDPSEPAYCAGVRVVSEFAIVLVVFRDLARDAGLILRAVPWRPGHGEARLLATPAEADAPA